MIKKITILFILFLTSLYAEPEKIDVYFLSPPKTSFINHFLNPFSFYKSVAMDKTKKCIPMGEGCFHPQFGIIPNEDQEKEKKPDAVKEVELKTINAEETSLIDCKEGNYFDIFCGKGKKASAPSKTELWIDTSSSMKGVDFSKEENFCQRRSIAAKIANECSGKIDILTFDTSIKTLGDLATTCINYGLNDGKRMVDWLKGSNAKHVVIITDVDEYIGEFREYLDLAGANIQGVGTEMYFSSDLSKLTDQLLKKCN